MKGDSTVYGNHCLTNPEDIQDTIRVQNLKEFKVFRKIRIQKRFEGFQKFQRK